MNPTEHPIAPPYPAAVSPFKITGPATISFSGGRTSAFMLRRILDEGLAPDVKVVFANTGKEMERTLAFVDACSRHWGVKIHWVERVGRVVTGDPLVFRWLQKQSFREVDFPTASRAGEPFADLINERGYLPNPVTRYCTVELKIRTIRRWAVANDLAEATSVIGLRADEMHRVVRIKARVGSEKGEVDVVCPLADAGIRKSDVMAFWGGQPFDLGLSPWEGNCDLCFLKGQKKRMRVMRDHPESSAWWAAQEAAQEAAPRASASDGGRFRNHGPTFAALAQYVRRSPMLPMFDDVVDDDPTDLGDCACTD